MMESKRALLLSLLFPIFLLAGLTLKKQSTKSLGQSITLPISGYDPRDLLSGHYLVYRIDYGVDVCESGSFSDAASETFFVCPNEKRVELFKPSTCDLAIRGSCSHGRFVAGVEKYFVPQEQALRLEKIVQSGKASVVLAVSRDGQAVVKDLLIKGKRWQNIDN